jgi:hypothetical protein
MPDAIPAGGIMEPAEARRGWRCKDLRHLKAHLEIVRIWDSINLKDGKQTEELNKLRASPQFQQFLGEKGLRGQRGLTQQSQLTSFIAYKLGIPNNKFTITAFRYKPILILARYFGDGVLAFLPRAGLLTLFKQLHIKTEGRRGRDKGELVFCSVMEKMIEKVPGITELCSQALNSLVEPILQERDLPPTLGLKLLQAGDIQAFQSAGAWELVTDGANLLPRVEEVVSESEPEPAASGGNSDSEAARREGGVDSPDEGEPDSD